VPYPAECLLGKGQRPKKREIPGILLHFFYYTWQIPIGYIQKFLPVLYEIPDKMFRTCYYQLKKRKIGKHKHSGTKRNFSLEKTMDEALIEMDPPSSHIVSIIHRDGPHSICVVLSEILDDIHQH
jgi:hypothetical protein